MEQLQSALKKKIRDLPQGPGVYLMRDRLGSVLYVGKAKNLKRRVSSYFQPSRKFRAEQPKIAAMVKLVHDIDIMEVKSEPEALLLEGKLIKEWRPRYNTDFTDDKRFLLVKVDVQSTLPRFRLVRVRNEDRSLYFGPFAHAGLLRKTLGEMRRRFGVILADTTPTQLEDGRWQLYDDARAEIYGHTHVVTEEEYRARVEEACVFLEGKSREWLVELKAEMVSAAQKQEFEKAAELRDIVFALEKTILRTRKFQRTAAPASVNYEEAMELLREALEMRDLPRRMECFDISHISGTYCVASMVHFENGKPNKAQYRRFKIRTFVGNDDFRAMEEVVGRRYRRLHEEDRPFPDLVVIDGGAGQVGAALKAFLGQGLEPPALIGLAKKEETVIFSDGRDPLNLPARHPGLRLLQRLRDEAHRFANTYNADLRSRKIRETVLDDFEGLGPVRRQALLDHFRTFERLKTAAPEEIAEVEGIGPKTAARLHEYLTNGQSG